METIDNNLNILKKNRGNYSIEDYEKIIENLESNYLTIKNETVFDYVINKRDIKYTVKLSEYIGKYKNSIIIPQYTQSINEESEIQELNSYNIEKMIKDLVPKNLRDKFEQILESLQKNPTSTSK